MPDMDPRGNLPADVGRYVKSTQRQVDELRRPALKPGPDLPWFCITAVNYTAGSPGWTIETLGSNNGFTEEYVVDQESTITSGFISGGAGGEGPQFLRVYINDVMVFFVQGDPGETLYTPALPVNIGDRVKFEGGNTTASGGIKLTGIHESVVVTWEG